MENSNQQQNQLKEDEIDIMALVMRLWENKSFIIKLTCIFAILGVLVAIFTPKEYTASCVVVPETKGGAFSASSLGGLAAIAGINLGAATGGEILSPVMYDKLLNNINLRKELMQTKITLEEYDKPISILDYYTNPLYTKSKVLSILKEYTIGLPFTIYKAITDKKDDKDDFNNSRNFGLSAYTKRELKCIKAFSKHFTIIVDSKDGDVTIVARMPEPLAAAQVVEALQRLLQKYVIELKLQKAEVNYEFIKQRYEEAKVVFDHKQEQFAKFQDANKILTSAILKSKEEQVRNEFKVAQELFNQLTSQLIQAEMKIKEDIPILTIVEPVQVPLEKSKPRRLILLSSFIFVGVVLSSFIVIFKHKINMILSLFRDSKKL